jgi:hydrogenase-4 component B
MSVEFTFGACLIAASSGLPGLLLSRRSPQGQRCAVVSMVVGCAIGLIAALRGLINGATSSMTLAGALPDWAFHLKLDPLAAFFQVPIFLLGAVGSVYGLRYWRQSEHPRNGRKLSLCYGLLVGSLGMVTLAGDGITFLFAWEIMAMAGFFLVSTEDHKSEARHAGWIYLVAAHVGILALFALFAVLRTASGSFDLRRLQPQEAGSGLQAVIFLLALAGFGLKAGVMPMHFWLPGAHASAPSHVSALLSGVVLKIGIYGLVRTLTLLPNLSAACGVFVLILGVVSAVFGVVFALGQHDLKRLLAYHSIENIGIILMGLGLAMIGLAVHRIEWVILGMGGCLLHVWNHSLFKALLFLAAGSVVRASRTREIDQLGGLAKRMPKTALLFGVGAIAICGLPPLNGFVSELLIYLGLLRTATAGHAGLSAIALAAPALAMVGALAVACFVKAYGAVFLGAARTSIKKDADEAPVSMVAPMALLAALCAVIGMFPVLVLPLLDRVLDSWGGISGTQLAELVPCAFLTTLGVSLVLAVAIGTLLLRRHLVARPAHAGVTWDCGYVRPNSRMQYTSSSFAGSLSGLFRWLLRPEIHHIPPSGLFPGGSNFESHVPDIILDGCLNPVWRRVKSLLASARGLQQGRVQRYLLYILLALFALLLSLVPVGLLVKKLLGR